MPTITDLLFLPWAAIILVSTIAAWRYVGEMKDPPAPSRWPAVAILVPVKGFTPTTKACFERLLELAYVDFRLVVAVESEADPAAAAISALQALRPGKITLVVAGIAARGGQKVANLLAALDAIEDRDEIVVFTDADTLPDAGWLRRVVASLLGSRFGAVTGYRWMVPTDASLSTAVVAAANRSIVTLPRLPAPGNLLWGGTIALRRETLKTIDIRAYWRGAVSDDLQMTRALHDHGVEFFSSFENLLLSPVAFDWPSAFAFAIRQYRLLFLHFPGLWCIGAVLLVTPVLSSSLAVVLAWGGSRVALVMLVLALACGEIRFRGRRRIAAALWREDQAGFLGKPAHVDRWLRPLWFGFHAACLVASPWSRKIRWAEIEYVLHDPQDVEILRRPTVSADSARAGTAYGRSTVD